MTEKNNEKLWILRHFKMGGSLLIPFFPFPFLLSFPSYLFPSPPLPLKAAMGLESDVSSGAWGEAPTDVEF